MLTVWSLCWGDKYDDYYVQRLQHEVRANLNIPHQFVCVTERKIKGVATVPPVVDWPGWWGKLALFKSGTSHNLYLDLDVVITGSLDELVMHHQHNALAMPWNWAQSGHGGCQSSVMMWSGGKAESIADAFDPALAHWPPVNGPGQLWGDQEFITEQRDAGFAVTEIKAGPIVSYKYHCRDGLPAGAKVVVFHGDPKPTQVRVSWFQW